MHGPGYPPPQQSRDGAAVIAWRVVFSLLAVFSCGMLAWATMLRLALVTRKVVDWLLFALVVGVLVSCMVLIASDTTKEKTGIESNISVGLMLLTAVSVLAYYLYSDIGHFRRRRAAPASYRQPVPQPGYGYPPQQSGGGYPQPPFAAPVTAPRFPPRPPAAPVPQPPPQRPSQPRPQPMPSQQPPHQQPPAAEQHPHPRIDQVRAELDELSDMLRKGQEDK